MNATRAGALALVAAMSLGALGLAPAVMRYWSERLGAVDRERRTAARTLKPTPPAPDGREAPEPPPVPRAEPSAVPLLREADPVERARSPRLPARDDEAPAEPEGELEAQPVPAAAEPAPVAPPPLTPAPPAASRHEPEPQAAAAPEPVDEGAPPAAEDMPEPAPIRRVSITVLEARTQPGLCRGASEALDARDALVARFPAVSWGADALLYLDPRLVPGTQPSLIADLEQAEAEISRVLQLAPPRPDVFAYYDTRLLLAGGCTNENVVAYYDGALHVVPSHDDVAQSIVHEYTHHALTSAGLLGPAWAHEGIAMHMAGETWWRSEWMARVAERPFSLEVMESAIPYTLVSDQAGLFYAQSAAMVACAIKGDPRGLRGLVESLAAGNERGELHYQLPPALAPLAWRRCFSDLAR